jgi:hypothetical protein
LILLVLPRGLEPVVFAVRETQKSPPASIGVFETLDNAHKIAICGDGRFWVSSPVYWTFVGHEPWRAELPMPGLRAEKAEAVFSAAASHTIDSSSQAYTLGIGG